MSNNKRIEKLNEIYEKISSKNNEDRLINFIKENSKTKTENKIESYYIDN